MNRDQQNISLISTLLYVDASFCGSIQTINVKIAIPKLICGLKTYLLYINLEFSSSKLSQ